MVQDELASLTPEHLLDTRFYDSNTSIWTCDDFIAGDVFHLFEWKYTIKAVQKYSLWVRVETDDDDFDLKRLETHYIRNNMDEIRYVWKVDREQHRRKLREEEEEKRKEKMLQKKKKQLAKLQEEIASLEAV
jgi:hypothetical protein